MPNSFARSTRRRARALSALAVLVLASSCEEATNVALGPLSKMNIVSGDVQSDTVGQRLPNALVVEAVDADGHKLKQQIVNFVVVKGGGSVFGGSNITNNDGIAQELWTLGTNTADSQVVEVRAVDNTTGAPKVFARFVAIPLADSAKTLTIASSSLTGALGAPLTDSTVALLVDKYANPVPGKKVGWSVLAGGGSSSSDSVTTGANGRAAVRWTLGLRLDTTHVLRAGVVAVGSAQVSATPTVPAGTSVSKVSGDAQTDSINKTLADSLVAKVTLTDGRAVQGVQIYWTVTSGTVSAASTKTGANGRGAIKWTFGGKPNSHQASAVVSGLTPAAFTATALTKPTQLSFWNDFLRGIANTTSYDSLVALVRDAAGNGVEGVTVAWSFAAGTMPPTSTTDDSGRASAKVTFGSTPGTYKATATAFGQSVQSYGFTVRPPMMGVAVGRGHVCGLLSDSTVTCGGVNSYGQVGNGTQSVFLGGFGTVASANGMKFRKIVGRGDHTCGLTAAGAAWCWGKNGGGVIGDGTMVDRPSVVAVSGSIIFADIDAGQLLTCGITAAGDAYCWGDVFGTVPSVVAGLPSVSSISVGAQHACARTAAGAAYCWGRGVEGQLGSGGFNSSGSTPVAVSGGLSFSQVRAGSYHSCGIASGTVYCWGYGRRDQLGLSDTLWRAVPTAVPVSGAIQVVPSALHTCAITAAGTSYCWGSNSGYQLTGYSNGYPEYSGPTTLHPDAVRDIKSKIVSLYANAPAIGTPWEGVGRNCGLTNIGELYCWGEYYTGTGTTQSGGVYLMRGVALGILWP